MFCTGHYEGEKERLDEQQVLICCDSHEPVHGPEEGDVLDGNINGREDDQHEDQGGTGDAGAGNTGGGGSQAGKIGRIRAERSQDRRGGYLHHGHIVHWAQLDVVHLGDEDGGDRDEQSRPVHVDGGAYGENKLGDPRVNFVILHTTECDW